VLQTYAQGSHMVLSRHAANLELPQTGLRVHHFTRQFETFLHDQQTHPWARLLLLYAAGPRYISTMTDTSTVEEYVYKNWTGICTAVHSLFPSGGAHRPVHIYNDKYMCVCVMISSTAANVGTFNQGSHSFGRK